ncbi:MAG: hypothetical protein M1429_02670 [Patescibacteria group bacterium]|nr:hypothetical protein [Patescibacteria group bacterium]
MLIKLTKVDYRILPQLRQALIDNCLSIREAKERIKEALLQSSYPELTEIFDLVPWISVNNSYGLDDRKPVFRLRDFELYLDLPIFDENEEAEKKRATGNGIFEKIKMQMEDEGKLPVVIGQPDRTVILKNCLNAGTVFGLPEEVETIKQKLLKPFENARIID